MTRALAIGVVAGILGLAWWLGAFELLSDPERVRQMLQESGPAGPVVFVLSFAAIQSFGVPAVLWLFPSALVWPLPVALVLSWLGATGSGLVGFGFSRWVARDWVAARLPERFQRLEERLSRSELRTVLLVRVFGFLSPPAHWALGISRVRVVPVVLGTAIGFVPGTVFMVLVGRGLFEAFSIGPTLAIAAMGAALALTLLIVWLRGIRRP